MGKVKVVVTGGGTGGHVYPAIAVARYLSREHPGWEVLFIGSAGGREADAADVYGVPFKGIELSGLAGRRSLDRPRALCLFARGVFRCRKILREFGATCVVGTGGYASAPACFAARPLGVPIILHEMNYRPGIVTRVLCRGAYAVAVADQGTGGLLPGGVNVVVTGVPVRTEMEALADPGWRAEVGREALDVFGLERGRKTLIVFGGSQGAQALNEALWEVLPSISERGDLQVLHLTGKRAREEPRLARVEESLEGKRLVYRAVAYVERMDLVYSVADMAVTRSGAGTVAELAAASVPSVLVPYPYAAGAHQEGNAELLQREGVAKMIKQVGDSALAAVQEAVRLMDDEAERSRMGAAFAEARRGSGAEGIAVLVEELIDGSREGRENGGES